jgi:hypothetical protein
MVLLRTLRKSAGFDELAAAVPVSARQPSTPLSQLKDGTTSTKPREKVIMSLTDSVSRAYGVTLAFRELANDAINEGCFPEKMATVMSGTAKEMALELNQQLAKTGRAIPSHCAKMLKSACINLEALGDLAGLVTQFKFTAKNAMQLALTLGYTAERTADVLKRLEDAL